MAASSAPILPHARKRAAPTPNALPEETVRRFVDDTARLTGCGAAGRIGIAVSGGPDSLALLLLAQSAFAGRVEAATVDHRLRNASVDEAGFVAHLCAARGIPHNILTLDALRRGNVSATARIARYAALHTWADRQGIEWIMTGHHADDQRETMIMRLNRGAGVAGLSGVRAKQGRIVRPLLHWRHDELAALVVEAGIMAVDDPTNHDPSYDRARLRQQLSEADWLDPQALSISADALADADAALDWAVDRLEATLVCQDDAGIAFARGAEPIPTELVRRLVGRCLRRIDPACDPRGVALSRLMSTLENGGKATLGLVIARGGNPWHFALAPPRRPTNSQ
jgi:tRNA(Ile)-lysidine synthase